MVFRRLEGGICFCEPICSIIHSKRHMSERVTKLGSMRDQRVAEWAEKEAFKNVLLPSGIDVFKGLW